MMMEDIRGEDLSQLKEQACNQSNWGCGGIRDLPIGRTQYNFECVNKYISVCYSVNK